MNKQLFRMEVIDASRERLAGTVVAAVPPSSRLYTRLVLAVAAIVVAILIFGSYATSARVRGIVAYDAGIARVYPSTPAEIRQIHVRDGQVVAAGAPLVTLSIAQGRDGVAAQLSQLGNQDVELGRQVDLAGAIGSAEGQGLAQQRQSLAAAIQSLERQRGIAAGQIRLAEAATQRAVDLARQGAGTQRQVEDSRSALLARRAEVESISERLIAQREALRTTEAQIGQRALETDRTRSVLLAQRAALAEQRAELVRTDRLVLTAPIGGEVGDVSVEVGQRARPDRSLVTIVPRGSRLEVWLYAPSRAVGFARPGQQVRLFFDAFPYQKYGAGRGTVTAVARVPTEPTNIDSNLGIEEPVFRIRVRIDEMAPRVPADQRAMRPGMTLSANLVLERRSLWEVLFGPVRSAVGR
jgi:membrane fusion protein